MIKRIISFFICAVIISCTLALPFAALDETSDNVEKTASATVSSDYDLDVDIGNVSSCVYDGKAQTVSISGTIRHDVLVTHNNYIIELYRIHPDETTETILGNPERKPLASTAISVKFDFSVSARNIVDILSRYAVIITSADGDDKLISSPVYPTVGDAYSKYDGDKSLFKGVSTDSTSLAADAGAMTSVIDVRLDRLLNSGSTGYLYSMEGNYIFFDRDYIDSLDVKVRTLSVSGRKVYLRFLLPSGSDPVVGGGNSGDGADGYDMPDISSASAMERIYAYADFLSDRYRSYEHGFIGGFILGRAVDDTVSSNRSAAPTTQQYSRELAFYATVTASAARNNIPDAEIVIPFSSADTYSSGKTSGYAHSSGEILSFLCEYFDEVFVGGFDFEVMLETSEVPFGITDSGISGGIDTEHAGTPGSICATDSHVFTDYLGYLKETYKSAPSKCVFFWEVRSDLGGNALACAYAYSYYKLFSDPYIAAFVIGFPEGDSEKLSDILDIVLNIDTSESLATTERLLRYFGVSNWASIVGALDADSLAKSSKVRISPSSVRPDGITGTFAYFDFADAMGSSTWFEGNGCDELKIGYGSGNERSLSAHFSAPCGDAFGYNDILCPYEYSENFIYTPYLAFNFSLSDDSEGEMLYEVKIQIGFGSETAESTLVIAAGESGTAVLELSDKFRSLKADYIRIASRGLNTDGGTYSFHLLSVEGYSTVYTSGELEELITEERLKARNLSSSDGQDQNTRGYLPVILMAVGIAVVIGVIIFIFLRHNDMPTDTKTGL